MILNQQYLYVTSDVFTDIAGDILVRRLIMRTSGVPRGLLRFLVLKLLAEKPMSGIEIVNEITQESGEKWKPSPGSIYPLLAWLQDKGYTKEALDQKLGMKRYTLTDEGRTYLEEHVKRKKEIRERFSAFGPHTQCFPWFNAVPEEARELFEAGKSLLKANWKLMENLRSKYSEEVASQAKETLEQSTVKLKELNEKLEQAN